MPAVWKNPPSLNGSPARALGDYTLDTNDISVSLGEDISADTVIRVHRKGRRYIFTDIDERGLGGVNRYECRAMLAVTDGQQITIIPSAADDGWGQPIEQPPVTISAFVQEETRTVANQYGEEAVVQLRIVAEGLAPVSYRDKVRYVNELGIVVEREPVRIVIRRRVDGAPLVTEVYV
ncbi:hypothetical protein [Paenibacillus chibensis]|uniref:hypothetical protein n=1 Tax=Paenibacillus chibensis TaxID=59846 RepID=UPI002DB87BC0|nr:hypothetical protein [Paenibacillus chibensis]MEC0370045.1 hypothetical protein [Paenibacillus chibensis]